MSNEYIFEKPHTEKRKHMPSFFSYIDSLRGPIDIATLPGDFISNGYFVERTIIIGKEGYFYRFKKRPDNIFIDCYEIRRDVFLDNVNKGVVPYMGLEPPPMQTDGLWRVNTGVVNYVNGDMLDCIIESGKVYKVLVPDLCCQLTDEVKRKLRHLCKYNVDGRMYLTLCMQKEQHSANVELYKFNKDREAWVHSVFDEFGKVEIIPYRDDMNMFLVIIDIRKY